MSEPTTVATATPTPNSCWAVRARKGLTLSPWGGSRAVGAFGLLAGGVGPDGRALDNDLGVDDDEAVFDCHAEAVEAAGGGAAHLLPHPAVLGAVARALEPLRRGAPRHPAAQVHALLVEGHHAAGHAFEHCAAV